MNTILVKNADIVITMDSRQPKIHGGGLFVRDYVIEQIGINDELPPVADQVIDATGMAIMPGLVNTHHHFFQSLFRALPGAQDHGLFDWLECLFPIYGELTAEALRIGSLTAMAEMILSGCTTSSDHHYLYSNDSSLDIQVQAAKEIGLRFHATRGAMSLGKSHGGLPPDNLVQAEDEILDDCYRLIDSYHDPNPFSMLRIGIAPCTPFSVTKTLMRESAKLARSSKNVRLHTHVAETLDEESFCLSEFNQRPAKYMEELEWLGPDVWWAHSIFVNKDEIKMLADTGTGVAHCPSSNMRLGSGICPVREMLDFGVKVGIGVDGSASNDCGHLINEARTAVLLQRVNKGASNFSVNEGLELATVGGASVLGRDEIGSLSAGKAADFIGVDLNTINMAGGAIHDPMAALLLCRVEKVVFSIINGNVVVQDGKLLTLDLDDLIANHNKIAAEMVSRHSTSERFSRI